MSSEFLREILDECHAGMDATDDGDLRLLSLTNILLSRLEDVGHISPPNVAYYVYVRGNVAAEVHGYACDTDDETLQLFYVIDDSGWPDAPPTDVNTTPADRIERAFKRMETFVSRCADGQITNVDESDPVHELLQLLNDASESGHGIEMCVLTTGQASFRAGRRATAAKQYAREVLDIVALERICGARSTGIIEVDFSADHGGALPCLVMPPTDDGIQVLLTCMPGKVLADIYLTHRAALLERNVRCFLQVRGKVNKGIRDTLLGQPQMLLPYNNGLSATAGSVELTTNAGGLAHLKRVSDLQIVNGGQTTATIAHCASRDNADLSSVRVAVKLSVVPPDRIDTIVPQISRCANTQNKVQDADFSANDPWHIRVEQMSRTLWTAATRDAVRGTRWFYERSHGQYADELGRRNTPAAKKTFKTENPPHQKITKTDAAKVLLGWDQQPAQVAKGAQKAFTAFMRTATDNWPATGETPEAPTFKKIVALTMLHKCVERLYGDMGFTGYRSQVVTYAVAKLSMTMGKRLDFEAIWRKHEIPKEMVAALKIIVPAVRDAVLNAPSNHRNISEWCKKDACWTAVSRLQLRLTGLSRLGLAGSTEGATDTVAPTPEVDGELGNVLCEVPQTVWFTLSSWARQTDNLRAWQRSLAYSLGILAAKGRAPSVKQSVQGRRLLIDAIDSGYTHPDLPLRMIKTIRSAGGGS
jgi:hypothetical protein